MFWKNRKRSSGGVSAQVLTQCLILDARVVVKCCQMIIQNLKKYGRIYFFFKKKFMSIFLDEL